MLITISLALLAAHVHGFDQTISTETLKLGKQQFEIIEDKAHLPNYGTCWTNAVERIKLGCKSLTDTVQIELALQLTACFMEMSGQSGSPQDCLNERTDALRRLCMSQMPDRIFAVYTEFFTQSQHMCYFLQSQVWNTLTEKTIVKLSSSSKLVSEQLAEAKGMQTVLLDYQKQGLDLQKTLLDHGANLSKSLNSSQTRLEQMTVDLRASTQEHMSLLEDLFRQFYLLQNWMVGKHSFLDRLLFYSGALLTIVVITSTATTQNSRIHLILTLMLNYGAEYVLVNNFDRILQLVPTVDPIDNVLMDAAVWQLRKFFIIVGLAIFLVKFLTFENVAKQQLKIFQDIQTQNIEIMEKLEVVLQMRARGDHRHQRSITPIPSTDNVRDLTPVPLDTADDHGVETPSRRFTKNIKDYLEETKNSPKNLCFVLKSIAEEDSASDQDRGIVKVAPFQRRRRTSVAPSGTISYSLRKRSVDKDF